MDIDAKRNATLQIFELNAHRNRTRIRNDFFRAATERHKKRNASLDYNRLRTQGLKSKFL